MPSLTNAWFADRAPGSGKQLIINGGANTVGINGVVGLGQPGSGGSSTPPATYAPLPEPGMVIPPPGSSTRPSFFLAFAAATGFKGNAAVALPTGLDGQTKWSLSCWLNFGTTNVVGFTPSPIFDVGGGFPGQSNLLYLSENNLTNSTPMGLTTAISSISGLALSVGLPLIGANFSYPEDFGLSSGWVHVMASINMTQPATRSPNFPMTVVVQLFVNDTLIFNNTVSGDIGLLSSAFNFASETRTLGASYPIPLGEPSFYGAITEFWEAPGKFVDWSNPLNRYKFHTSDGFAGSAFQTFAPVNLGPTGSRPFGYRPLTYLSGPPSLFPNNRAGGALSLTGGPLILIDDPPT